MEKTFKTSDVLSIYNIINTAKYNKMDDDDKIKVWKIVRAMKPVATKFDEDMKDASEKLKPTDDFNERLQKAQEYERLRSQNKPTNDAMADEEYEAFIKEFKNYNKVVEDAIKEFGDKEVKITFDAISEKAFGNLMASNDWTMEQAVKLGEVIVE